MDHFFDAAARILASQMPRRQALMRLGGLLAGGVLTTLGVSSARAQAICDPACSGKKATCCPGTTTPFCTTTGKICCGNKSCKADGACCPGITAPFCRTKNKRCCGDDACKSNEVCCGGTTCCKECTPTGKCSGSPS